MSSKPKDLRPRIVSYDTEPDGLNKAVQYSVLWPCHAFNISIPQMKKSGLNVFEEIILKITEIESGDTDKIALLTCLDRELVAFIQNRLSHLGVLNDRNELSEHGQELLSEWKNGPTEKIEFTVATVFVDLLSGQILPYVSTDQLIYKKISRIGGNKIVHFLNNPTKENSRVSARLIRPVIDSHWKKVPNTNDIIRAIRAFKKKYKRHTKFNQGADQYPPPVPVAEAISINRNPELVYLHCYALIQKGNSDLLVTDGFGFGFSENFANRLSEHDSEWVIDLKKMGVIEKPYSIQSGEKTESESLESDELVKYGRIIRPLRRAEKGLSRAKNNNVDSTHSEHEFTDLVGKVVVALYEAIEWTLLFIVSDNPVTQWERFFSSQSYQENDKILRGFATKIGFDVSDSIEALLQVKPGKLKAFERGVTEMQPLLALAIAGAISYPNHPFHQLAIEDSGFFSFINALKANRDPVSHGKSAEVELSLRTLEGYRDRTVRLIRALVPDIIEDSYTTETEQERDIDQVRLKARIELDKSLGLGFVQAVSPSLREELVKVAILSQRPALDSEQAQRYVNLMASIMQLSLFEVAKERRSSISNPVSLRDEAIAKIFQSGFYPALDTIPEQISRVNTDRLHRAVQGSSATLGAHLLAVFLLGSESELIELQKSAPELVDLVTNLIQLRGHGNNQQSDFSGVDMEQLKDNVLKAIKIMTEVF